VIVIERFDPTTAPQELLRQYYELDMAIEHEVEPDDPSPPFDRAVLDYVDPPSWTGHQRWIAREGHALVGHAVLELEYVETNRHIGAFNIGVRPERRKEGIGTRLLQPVVDAATADGRTVLESWTTDGTPGDAFAATLALDTRYFERRSRLVTGELDRAMLDQWVTRARQRAADYSLFGFDDACPEALLDQYIAVNDVMNTAPREELDMEDEHFTPDRIRERDRRAAQRDDHLWCLIVRHDPTGHFAGYTEIEWSAYMNELVWQGGTAVDPVHREKGLGRWLKAAMLLRLLDERPEVRYVDTWNAGSNEPMLAINVALGFRPAKHYNARQIATEALGEAIAKRV
jgi:mycothiol synthase